MGMMMHVTDTVSVCPDTFFQVMLDCCLCSNHSFDSKRTLTSAHLSVQKLSGQVPGRQRIDSLSTVALCSNYAHYAMVVCIVHCWLPNCVHACVVQYLCSLRNGSAWQNSADRAVKANFG